MGNSSLIEHVASVSWALGSILSMLRRGGGGEKEEEARGSILEVLTSHPTYCEFKGIWGYLGLCLKEKKESYYHRKAREICLKGWISSILENPVWIRLFKEFLLLTAGSYGYFQSLLTFIHVLQLADLRH